MFLYREVDNDMSAMLVAQTQSAQMAAGGQLQGHGPGRGATLGQFRFGMTLAPTAQNRFPLPAPVTVHTCTVPFPSTAPWASVSLNPVSTAAAFMSQSEGYVLQNSKCSHYVHNSNKRCQPAQCQMMIYVQNL